MWPCSSGRWSRWAWSRCSTGISLAIGRNGGSVGGGRRMIWLASILTEGDHRKVSVETSLKGVHHTLSRLTAQVIEPLDLSDDRLSHLLKHLSKPAYWHQIEKDLNERSIEVYDLHQ